MKLVRRTIPHIKRKYLALLIVALLFTISINADIFHNHNSKFEPDQDCALCQIYSTLQTAIPILFIFVFEFVLILFSFQYTNNFVQSYYQFAPIPRAPPHQVFSL